MRIRNPDANLVIFNGFAYLSAVCVLEEEVEDGGGDLGANGGAQVHLVALQHVLNVAGPPVCHGPAHRIKVYVNL
jgi:hypothetical protein